MYSPHSLMLPETTQSTHPIYTLFRDPEGEMVGMECQDEMEEMESQESKGRGETLVCRDHLARKVCMHEQSTNHTSLKNRPMTRCYAKSPTVQDAIRPIPGLISCAGVTGRWGLLSCAQNAARWLVLFKRLVKALRRHLLFMQLFFVQRSHAV